MNLTIQIITQNNSKTLDKCLKSVLRLNCYIIVADIGSTDDTCIICRRNGINPRDVKFNGNYSELRNELTSMSNTPYHMYIHPWEAIVQGHDSISNINGNHRVQILQGTFLTSEIRIWEQGQKFCNPVYEYIKSDATYLPVMIYSQGEKNPAGKLDIIKKWKRDKPLAIEPYYYEACVFLALGRYDEFLGSSEYFMKGDPKMDQAAIMNKYYYASVQAFEKKRAKPAMQNITQCLAHKPLMAEFWCLAGDIHYHLMNSFGKAKSLYENAMILGCRRMKNDNYPMDISKYYEYPTKMIESCDEIMQSTAYYTN